MKLLILLWSEISPFSRRAWWTWETCSFASTQSAAIDTSSVHWRSLIRNPIIDLDDFCRYLIKDIHTMEAATVCRTRSLSLNCAILRPSITFSVKSTMPRVWTSKLEERHIYLVFTRVAEREAVLWGSTYDYWEADTRNDKADTIAFARITERETILWGSTYDVGRGVFFFSN